MHKCIVQERTVRKAVRVGSESSTPGTHLHFVNEYLVTCDKCGAINKSADYTMARSYAKRHEGAPVKFPYG